MFAQYCARSVVNTLTESVNAIPDGRVKNVLYDMMSAKCPIAMDMVIALVASANASEDTKENTAKKVSGFFFVCYLNILRFFQLKYSNFKAR